MMTTVLEELNSALHKCMEEDERVYILGEDLLDPYGGAFRVTRGLSSAYPQRVYSSPISEAGIVGVAAGMAMRGLRPVVEIMFGDFVALIGDQVINHLAKYRWMYNNQVRVPVVIRTPMGGRRGYGPTHSQTLEKHFIGVPGLRVLAPTALGHPGKLLQDAIQVEDDPVLFVENKLLYISKINTESSMPDFVFQQHDPQAQDTGRADSSALLPAPYAPTYSLGILGAPRSDLTIVAYGYMAQLAQQAIFSLAFEYELFAQVLIPTQLSPIDMLPILESARISKRVLCVEEGSYTLGWGAEVIARLAETMGSDLLSVGRVAAADLPVPSSAPLEEAVLPDTSDIIQAAIKIASGCRPFESSS